MKKNRLYIGLAVVFGIILVAGITAAAVTNYGTQANPLVTKSYIDDVASKKVLDDAGKLIDAKAKELETKISGIVSGVSSGNSSAPASFTTITLNTSQVIRCSLGSEIILRSGTATCYGNGPDFLIDQTLATTFTAAGTALVKNHSYLVSVDRNGLRARSDGTVILVSGEYTIYNNL